MRIVGPLMERRLRSPADAARAVLRAAVAGELEGVTGRFLDETGELPRSRKCADAALRGDLLRRAASAVAP